MNLAWCIIWCVEAC